MLQREESAPQGFGASQVPYPTCGGGGTRHGTRRRSRPTGTMRGRPGSAMPITPVVSSGSRAPRTSWVYGRDTQKTMYALRSALGEVHDFRSDDVRFTSHPLMHIVAQDDALAVLFVGASMVLLDSWSGERGLRVLSDSGTTAFVVAPSLVYDLIAATGREARAHLP